MTMTIDEIFNTFRNGTDQDKATLREFLWKNLHLLSSPAFVQAAVANADLFIIPGMTPEEAEAYDAALEEAEDYCPHCGHPQCGYSWGD